MKITREKAEILLMEYAAGALDEACSLLVASYVTLCPEARRYTRQCEDFGGALMAHDCDPVAMHESSLQDVLGRLDHECEERRPNENCRFCEEQPLPLPIANHINRGSKGAKWHKISPGMQFYALSMEEGCYTTKLIRMRSGAKTPRHQHPGLELTLVLEGGYSDEFGHYRAGDLVIIDENVTHGPVANEEGCVYLVVTEAPVRFTGSFGTLLNIFMR